jgi:hypothetical protein
MNALSLSEPPLESSRDRAGDPAWLRAVLVFNLSPAVYAHSSWLPTNGMTAQSSRTTRRQLSDALIAEHGLDDCFDWSPSSHILRPMLLSPESWAELSLTVGVLAHRNHLRQVVKRELFAQWSALLGDRMELLWSPLADRLPAVSPSVRPPPSTETVATMLNDGQAVLLGLLNPQHDFVHANVMRRAQLRLPRARLLDTSAWQPELADADVLAGSLMDDLLPRRSSEWTWLS